MFRLLVATNLLLSTAPSPLDYWSPERIAAARPAELPSLETRPFRTVPGSQVVTPGGDSLGYAPVPLPYQGSYRLNGVLLSHDPATGTDIACGAAVIRSRSRSLVLTAAHCLHRRGRAMEHVAFAPAYESGLPMLGVWPAVRTWVPKRWSNRPYSAGQLPYDVGLAGVVRGAKPLEAVTGPGLRPMPSAKSATLRNLELLGYPIGRRYSGRDMYRCLGDAIDGGAGGPGVLVTHNCQAAAGSSGGPAVYGGAVAGVVSSSTPLRDPAGYTVLTRLNAKPFGRLLARADREMRGWACRCAS